VIDWYYRARGRHTINPAREITLRADAIVAVVAFVLAFGAAVPFMNTSLVVGPVAKAWHGADVAYYVDFLVAAIIYGGYRVWRHRATVPAAALGSAPTPAHKREPSGSGERFVHHRPPKSPGSPNSPS
jgi:hypothetical protein